MCIRDREVDIVAASLFVTCGGVLVLQGWRLDPMLMLSEGVLSAVSIYYMIQTVTLRKELEVWIHTERLVGAHTLGSAVTLTGHAGTGCTPNRFGQVGWTSSRPVISSSVRAT